MFEQKNICHILDSTLTIKCIFYDNIYFENLQYGIDNKNFQNSIYSYHYNNYRNFIKIASSKSKRNNNYLVCPLFIKYYYNIYEYKFSYCSICYDESDFNDCSDIDNLYEENCSNLETYYFNETDNFIMICQTQYEFILFFRI